MTINQLVAAFFAHCEREGRSPKTTRFYQSRLKLFLAKFGARPAGSLKSIELKEFLHAARQGYSGTTQHHNVTAVVTLHSFALNNELITKPWFLGKLKKPPIARRERIPTPAEIARLLERAPPAFRQVYIGLAQSGTRPGELCRATIGDIHARNGTRPQLTQRTAASLDGCSIVLVEHKTAAKTGRPRIIAIGAHFAATLCAAIGERTELTAPIFLNSKGEAWTPENLSGIHRRLRDAAGLDKTIVLYCTRHRFATELLKKKKPLKDVAELMGHANTSMTERYGHIDVTDLAVDQDAVPDVGVDESPPEKPAA